MNLKTFRAKSMAQALAEVKKQLGKDAVILHTRAYRVGAVMGMGGHDEYEITAADATAAAAANARGPSVKQTAGAGSTGAQRRKQLTTPIEIPAPVGDLEQDGADFVPATFSSIGVSSNTIQANRADQETESASNHGERMPTQKASQQPVQSASQRIEEVKPVPADTLASLTTRADFAPADPEAFSQLKDELGSIRRLVGQLLTETRRATAGGAAWGSLSGILPASMAGLGEPLMDASLSLQESGLRAELIDRVIGATRDELTPDELKDAAIVTAAVQRHLASLIPVSGHVTRAGQRVHQATGTNRPLIIALIGPTGVGKTTTIAKLAASYALKHNAKVGFITCDTYRIAAVDQLRTYASILNIPLKVALTPQEAKQAIAELSDCGVILVDSAGRAPQDTPRLDELAEFLTELAPDETHLVLSVGQAEEVQLQAATKFSLLKPTHLLLSKLDEAVRFGVIANVVQTVCGQASLKVSYVTTGQEVPAQIELAHPERMARLVMNVQQQTTSATSRGEGDSRQ